MCGDLFYIDYDYNQHLVRAHAISVYVTRVIQQRVAGQMSEFYNGFTPDDTLDEAEEAVFACFADSTNVNVKAKLASIDLKGIRKVIFADKRIPTGGRTGEHIPASGRNPTTGGCSPTLPLSACTDTIYLDRQHIKSVSVTLDPATNSSNEAVMHNKNIIVMAETTAHELCHAIVWPSTHSEPLVYNAQYWGSAMGICEKNLYDDALGKKPLHHTKLYAGVWDWGMPNCLPQVKSANDSYFKSMHELDGFLQTIPPNPAIDWIP